MAINRHMFISFYIHLISTEKYIQRRNIHLSFITTVTETMTRELLVNYHGKKLPTQILDTQVHVETITLVISSTIEITPTPSYLTLTVTPTLTQPSTVPVISKIQV